MILQTPTPSCFLSPLLHLDPLLPRNLGRAYDAQASVQISSVASEET